MTYCLTGWYPAGRFFQFSMDVLHFNQVYDLWMCMEYSASKAPDMAEINLKPWFEPIINSMGQEGSKKVNLEKRQGMLRHPLQHIATRGTSNLIEWDHLVTYIFFSQHLFPIVYTWKSNLTIFGNLITATNILQNLSPRFSKSDIRVLWMSFSLLFSNHPFIATHIVTTTHSEEFSKCDTGGLWMSSSSLCSGGK